MMAEPLRYRHNSIGRARAFRRNMTDAEKKLWSRLRGNQLGYYFRRQVPIGKYIVDFVCRKDKLVIEIDGSQHYTKQGKEQDAFRDRFLQEQGFRVLHFNTIETLENTDGVIGLIYDNLRRNLL